MKLTAQFLKTLTPGTRRQVYVDDVVPGLRVIVRPKGGISWVFRYSYSGRDRSYTIGKLSRVTLEKARERGRELTGQVALGQDPQGEKVKARRTEDAISIRQLGTRALKHLDLRPKSRVEFARLFKVEILPAFGNVPVNELTRGMIRQWSERKAKTAPYSANRAFEVLRRFYSWGVERDLLTASPFVNLKKPAKERPSDRVLSTAELWALLRALEELEMVGEGNGPDAVKLLLWTGARREMVLGARREEFEDLDGLDPRWVIPADRMKSRRAHVVPLCMQAVKLVDERLRKPGAFLFPAGQARNGVPARRQSMAWKSAFVTRLRKRLQAHIKEPVPRWTIHNLRHTVATHMREHLSVRPDVVSLILGHAVGTGPAVTQVYLRAELLKERRAALKAWAMWLERLPEPKSKLLTWREA